MKTLDQAVSERESTLNLVNERAGEIIFTYCRRKGFLFVGRAKAIESLQDKLETGRYASLDDMDDMIAFSVVVDTLSQINDVKKFLDKSFELVSVKSGTTLQDERLFDFDCPRIYCRLEDKLGTGSGIDKITIEVQIRTILQHAWSKITHPLVYKASSFDARGGRLAAELLAQLESVDRSLSRFKTTAKTVKSVKRPEMNASGSIMKMIDDLVEKEVIPKEMRPRDGRRLGENIFRSIRRKRRGEYRKLSEKICSFISDQKGAYPRSVSIYQLAIIALFQDGALETGAKRHYYVTDEMVSLFPVSASIPNRVKID